MNALRTTLKTNGYLAFTDAYPGNGNLCSLRVKSKSSSAIFIHLFDLADAPDNGDTPSFPPIPIQANGYYESDTRLDFVNGLWIGASSTEATFTPIGSNDAFICAQIA